jgi:hypothetical protein
LCEKIKPFSAKIWRYSCIFFGLAILKDDLYIQARGRNLMDKGNRSSLTNKQMKDLLPKVLNEINMIHRDRPDLILAAWPQIIGDKLASMTKAVGFEKGILVVKVSNSTLYSLLSQHERGRLLKKLREQFPGVGVKNIHFRIG